MLKKQDFKDFKINKKLIKKENRNYKLETAKKFHIYKWQIFSNIIITVVASAFIYFFEPHQYQWWNNKIKIPRHTKRKVYIKMHL